MSRTFWNHTNEKDGICGEGVPCLLWWGRWDLKAAPMVMPSPILQFLRSKLPFFRLRDMTWLEKQNMSSKEIYCPVCGQRMPEEYWKYKNQADQRAIKCPKCNSYRIWRDAKRNTPSGAIQRYLCRKCGYRFSKY